jgi:hypothetical protein
MKLCVGFLREIARPRRFRVGYRYEPYGWMLRREPRAQPADAAGADDGDAEILALDVPLPRDCGRQPTAPAARSAATSAAL